MSEEQFIVNPKTKRKVKVGSAVHKKLVREGLVESSGLQEKQYVKKEPQETESTPTPPESEEEELVKEKKPKKREPKKKQPKE